jgi:hypothetical protein
MPVIHIVMMIRAGRIKTDGSKRRPNEFSKSSLRTSLDLFVRYGMSLNTGIRLNQNMQMPWIAFNRFFKIILPKVKSGGKIT